MKKRTHIDLDETDDEPQKLAKTKRFCGDRGAGEFFLIILMTSLVGFAGLAYDAGMAFNARREAVGVAGAAARAGADQINETVLYGLGIPSLDQGDAQSAAVNFALNHGAETAQAQVPGTYLNRFQVKVQVTKTHDNLFLGWFGVDEFVVVGEGTANVESNFR